ncbi:MAG TPA: deoxyribose-phosphate aldolase [Acidimicrobiia bacterium]|jgi:deoxyribose-phosphate aldolase|nr:deoxyribose-phosphate aldolase [Acidimicrobiia bacterium]
MEPISLTVDDVTYEQLAGTIDHSLLKPMLTTDDVIAGCRLAAGYRVVSVCVRPADVTLAASELEGADVAVGTVISFPHGDSTTSVKVDEAKQALEDGAVELDMVLNIGWLLSGRDEEVQNDIAAVVDASGDALVKVIFENAYLTDAQKVAACRLSEKAGADYVKTSTGYAPTGATVEDIRLMRANVGPRMKVKAAHGVRTLDALLAVIEAGAERCGATATAVMLDDYLKHTRTKA